VDDQPSDAAHTPEEIKVQSVWIGVRHNFGSGLGLVSVQLPQS